MEDDRYEIVVKVTALLLCLVTIIFISWATGILVPFAIVGSLCIIIAVAYTMYEFVWFHPRSIRPWRSNVPVYETFPQLQNDTFESGLPNYEQAMQYMTRPANQPSGTGVAATVPSAAPHKLPPKGERPSCEDEKRELLRPVTYMP